MVPEVLKRFQFSAGAIPTGVSGGLAPSMATRSSSSGGASSAVRLPQDNTRLLEAATLKARDTYREVMSRLVANRNMTATDQGNLRQVLEQQAKLKAQATFQIELAMSQFNTQEVRGAALCVCTKTPNPTTHQRVKRRRVTRKLPMPCHVSVRWLSR